MKSLKLGSLIVGASFIALSGCDTVGTNNETTRSIDVNSLSTYSTESPAPVLFPLVPDTTIYFTTDADTSGRE